MLARAWEPRQTFVTASVTECDSLRDMGGVEM